MHQLIGSLLIILSAIAFGAMAIFFRLAYEAGVSLTAILFLRFGIASVCMLFIMVMRRFPFPKGQVLLILILMGAVGYAGQSLCYFAALTLASASLVALLLYLYPAIVATLAVLILKEPISRGKLIALFSALLGTLLTIGFGGGGKPLGVLFALGGALIYSIYILVGSRVAKKGSAIPFSTVIISSAAAVYGGVIAVKGVSFPVTWEGWVWALAIALISTVFGVVAFLAGLERVGPTNAVILSTVEPAVTVILAALVLGEHISVMRAVGGAFILLAVITLAKERHL